MKQRMRIRFCKEGDLRLISHRDLVRVFERLFRRAAVPLSMSEGYHPKPRMSFPSALALGIRATDEVMEVELAEETAAGALHARLSAEAPLGLVIDDVSPVPPGHGKAQIERVTYELPIPRVRHDEVACAADRLMSRSSYPIQRAGREEPIDLRADLCEVTLTGNVLRMRLKVSRTAGARPVDVLDALGLADLTNEGCVLTRSAVEITS